MPKTVDIEVLPKQMEFLTAEEREVLYSGAFGAGKTRAVCLKAAMRASVPGSREALCRKHLVTFKATTLKTLLEADGDRPPILPQGSYKHNKSEKVIKLKGGGEIIYFGLDEPEKIGSHNLSGCGVDEAVEVDENDWTMLRGRLRLECGLPRQIYGACNPGSPSHWLAERFGLAMGYQCEDNCRAIQTTSLDNTFLPADYIADLKTFQGLAKARYVDGIWAGSEGLVYDNWERGKFVMDRHERRWDRILVGMDEGYTNPAVMLLLCVDNDGRIHVADEWYKSRQLETQVVTQAEIWERQYEPERFMLDPSAAKLREAMREANINAQEADNDVFGGIQAVQKRLVVAGDGRPRLTVAPRCENTIREFETYEWKPREKNSSDYKDEPLKMNDHAMDALRYGVMAIDGSGMDWEPVESLQEETSISRGFSRLMGG